MRQKGSAPTMEEIQAKPRIVDIKTRPLIQRNTENLKAADKEED